MKKHETTAAEATAVLDAPQIKAPGKKGKAAAALDTLENSIPDGESSAEVEEEGTLLSKTQFRNQEAVNRVEGFTLDPRLIIADEKTNPRIQYSKNDEEWEEFKNSIRNKGLRVPLHVYAMKNGAGEISYHLAQGFRRNRAIKEIIAETPDALKTIPVELVSNNREKMLADHITLNKGKELRDIEVANIIEQFQNWGYDIPAIADKLDMKETKVKYLLAFVTDASHMVRKAVEEDKISLTAANVQLVKRHKNLETQNKKLNEAVVATEKKAAEDAAAGKTPAKAGKIKATAFEGTKIDLNKSVVSLVELLDQLGQQSPDEVDAAAITKFKQIVALLQNGHSNVDIYRAHFKAD